jgi:hypothetical protein
VCALIATTPTPSATQACQDSPSGPRIRDDMRAG